MKKKRIKKVSYRAASNGPERSFCPRLVLFTGSRRSRARTHILLCLYVRLKGCNMDSNDGI